MNLKPFLICVLLVFVFGLCGYSQAIQVKNDNGSPLTSQDDIIGKYARLLNVPKDSIKDVRLYTLIELYSGAPYKLGGNDANGIDCSGFSCIIEKMIYGITIPRSTGLQSDICDAQSCSRVKRG